MTTNKQTDNPMIQSRLRTVNETHYYLVGEIRSAIDHIELLDALNMASPDDEVIIHINSNGGCANTAIQIMSAINRCEGHVTTIIEGEAASAASMIFLTGHSMSVTPHSCMMIHTWSSGSFGKSQELVSDIMFNKERFEKLFDDVYDGFLTKAEQNSIAKGMDLYLDSEQILKRLKDKHPQDEQTSD